MRCKDEKVSFTIVTEHELMPEKLDTMYTSVVVFGRARVIHSKEETKEALRLLLARLSPSLACNTEKIYNGSEGKFIMVEISAEHISGKIGR